MLYWNPVQNILFPTLLKSLVLQRNKYMQTLVANLLQLILLSETKYYTIALLYKYLVISCHAVQSADSSFAVNTEQEC